MSRIIQEYYLIRINNKSNVKVFRYCSIKRIFMFLLRNTAQGQGNKNVINSSSSSRILFFYIALVNKISTGHMTKHNNNKEIELIIIIIRRRKNRER